MCSCKPTEGRRTRLTREERWGTAEQRASAGLPALSPSLGRVVMSRTRDSSWAALRLVSSGFDLLACAQRRPSSPSLARPGHIQEVARLASSGALARTCLGRVRGGCAFRRTRCACAHPSHVRCAARRTGGAAGGAARRTAGCGSGRRAPGVRRGRGFSVQRCLGMWPHILPTPLPCRRAALDRRSAVGVRCARADAAPARRGAAYRHGARAEAARRESAGSAAHAAQPRHARRGRAAAPRSATAAPPAARAHIPESRAPPERLAARVDDGRRWVEASPPGSSSSRARASTTSLAHLISPPHHRTPVPHHPRPISRALAAPRLEPTRARVSRRVISTPAASAAARLPAALRPTAPRSGPAQAPPRGRAAQPHSLALAPPSALSTTSPPLRRLLPAARRGIASSPACCIHAAPAAAAASLFLSPLSPLLRRPLSPRTLLRPRDRSGRPPHRLSTPRRRTSAALYLSSSAQD
jgi:hypothetical protein